MRAQRKRKKYKTLFFFDRTVPRDLYFSIQKRLNYLGYGGVWQPRSAVRGKDREINEILDYCVARGIRVYVTFSKNKNIEALSEYQGKIKIIKLKGGRKKTVNKIIALLFMSLRNEEKN